MNNVTVTGPRISTTCETQCQPADEEEVSARMRADGWKRAQRESHEWGTVTLHWVRDTKVLEKDGERIWKLLK